MHNHLGVYFLSLSRPPLSFLCCVCLFVCFLCCFVGQLHLVRPLKSKGTVFIGPRTAGGIKMLKNTVFAVMVTAERKC